MRVRELVEALQQLDQVSEVVAGPMIDMPHEGAVVRTVSPFSLFPTEGVAQLSVKKPEPTL